MTDSTLTPAITKALDLLSSKLGDAKDVTTAGPCLQLIYAWTGGDVGSLLSEIGARVDVSMVLPGLTPRRGGVMVIGELQGVRFNTKTEGAGDEQKLAISLYPETSDAAAYKQRLEAIHSMADSLFASLDGASTDTLVSYVVRKLNDSSNSNSSRRLAALLAGVIADHLSSQVSLDDDVAAQLAAATSIRR